MSFSIVKYWFLLVEKRFFEILGRIYCISQFSFFRDNSLIFPIHFLSESQPHFQKLILNFFTYLSWPMLKMMWTDLRWSTPMAALRWIFYYFIFSQVRIDFNIAVQGNYDQVVESFDDMELKEELLRGIYGFGFEKPSAIQKRAIVPCTTGKDVIAQAQSGTGKTATFSVSILQRIDHTDARVQALVMAPTRELAQQVS